MVAFCANSRRTLRNHPNLSLRKGNFDSPSVKFGQDRDADFRADVLPTLLRIFDPESGLQFNSVVPKRQDQRVRGRVGKNARIYTGAKEAPAMPAGTGDPILDLASFRELQASCK